MNYVRNVYALDAFTSSVR